MDFIDLFGDMAMLISKYEIEDIVEASAELIRINYTYTLKIKIGEDVHCFEIK